LRTITPRASRRPRIAVLIDFLLGDYQLDILEALQAHARLAETDLLIVVGGALTSDPGLSADRNFAFDLPGPNAADGELAISATIASREALSPWLSSRRKMPRFSFGMELPGVPSSAVDNRAGVHAAVDHLIETHGRHRIAFVGGPSSSSDARERLEAYERAMTAHGLEVDPRLVVEGGLFDWESGVRAIGVLLDERRIEVGALDAVVAANDAMALGAMAELERRGQATTDNVAVVGFDDVELAQLCWPPLTTVRQPVAEQAREAFTSLLTQLRGEPVEPLVTLPTRLVVRRSCGCLAHAGPSIAPPPPGTARSFEVAVMVARERIQTDLVRAARGELGAVGPGWDQRLLASVVDAIGASDPTAFTRTIEDVLVRVGKGGSGPATLGRVLHTLRKGTLACLPAGEPKRSVLEDLFAAALELVTEARVRAEMEARSVMSRQLVDLLATTNEVARLRDMPALVEIAQRRLPQFGIDRACVAILRGDPGPAQTADLVFSYTPAGPMGGPLSFTAGDLAPPGWLDGDQPTLVLMPIAFGAHGRAMALFGAPRFDGRMIEEVAALLSCALTTVELAGRAR
jgi:phosphoserine phosphatase RsbU/P